jgi:hypothetical protein
MSTKQLSAIRGGRDGRAPLLVPTERTTESARVIAEIGALALAMQAPDGSRSARLSESRRRGRSTAR